MQIILEVYFFLISKSIANIHSFNKIHYSLPFINREKLEVCDEKEVKLNILFMKDTINNKNIKSWESIPWSD